MTDNPIYQLDLAYLRGYNRLLAERFPTPDVTLIGAPYWSFISGALMVGIENTACGCVVPCECLTPNPAPHFRFIVTSASGERLTDETVQGIPVQYAVYAPILLAEGFQWVGVNLGSQRVSIECVIPPVGEEV